MLTDRDKLSGVEVELGKDDLGQGLLDARSTLHEEGLRVFEQLQSSQEELSAGVELGRGVGQLALNLSPLSREAGQLLLDLGLGPARLPNEVEVLLLFGVQFAQTGLEALLQRLDVAQLTQQGVIELCPNLGPEVLAEPHRGVVLFDGFQNLLDLEIGQVATAGLAPSAEEVEVGAAVAPARCDDEPLVTASAPQQALGPMVVLTLAGASAPA
ncbi:MAG TPA: hypothetical protein VET29_09485 [Actinophytocola sp.]|nr:hypothetical protein [Actinophytocola sp.]HYQ63489.1 hypothetical protein [Actinophytocola sp.]